MTTGAECWPVNEATETHSKPEEQELLTCIWLRSWGHTEAKASPQHANSIVVEDDTVCMFVHGSTNREKILVKEVCTITCNDEYALKHSKSYKLIHNLSPPETLLSFQGVNTQDNSGFGRILSNLWPHGSPLL